MNRRDLSMQARRFSAHPLPLSANSPRRLTVSDFFGRRSRLGPRWIQQHLRELRYAEGKTFTIDSRSAEPK
jgi:hypothetical protein